MNQSRKITHTDSVADADIKPQARKNKNQGANPKKQMIRSHSESTIGNIICSSQDFKQILTESQVHQFADKRIRTPLVQPYNRPRELEESAPSPRVLKRVTKLPMRECAGSEPSSPVLHLMSKREILLLSPLMLNKNKANASKNRNSIFLPPRALASRLAKNYVNIGEPDSMLPKDKNEKSLNEETCFVDEAMNQAQDENKTSSQSDFDPKMIGEAIERHLARQQQMSPGRRSPRSPKTILGQNNSQISSRLGSLISRLPFKQQEGRVDEPCFTPTKH